MWANLALGRDALAAAAKGESVKAGRLQQAVVVEAKGAAWYAAEVSAVGRQGLLPKLDVVLLVNHFLRGQLRLHTRLPRRRPALLEQLKAALPPPAIKQQQRYLALLDGMASFMAMQVGGLPDGAHAAFKEYAVDAVTARMLSEADKVSSDTPSARQILQLAAAVEGTLRSLNNLLERLHHSYFMYLLPAMNKFVPIEAYTLPPALQLLALFLLAANACLCLPTPRPAVAPSQPGSTLMAGDGPGGGEEEGSGCGDAAAAADVDTFPRQMMQPITIRGGWNAVALSCSRVAVVHAAAAGVGLAVHVGAVHAAGGTVWGDISTPWPAVLLGAASSAFVVSMLAVEGFRRPWSEDAAQMYYAVSLLSTLVLMAAWMFVNWADVYCALLCCTPLIAQPRGHKARLTLWAIVGCLSWMVLNPWALIAEQGGSRGAFGTDLGAWLFRISPTSQAFTWLVYVPTWVKPWI